MTILRCRCASPYQDAVYGDKLRVHNRTRKSDGTLQRCTVCGDEKLATVTPAPGAKPTAAKAKKSKSKEDGKRARK